PPPHLSFHALPPPYISTLSLHDALPISRRDDARPRWPRRAAPAPPAERRPRAHAHREGRRGRPRRGPRARRGRLPFEARVSARRSEEHTSELQSQSNLVCRLLLEKKKKK